MPVLTDLQHDYRLLRKYFGKRFQSLKGGELVMNGIGIFLVGTMFATVMFQKDFAKEGVERWSPFRYHNPNSVWHDVYQVVSKSSMLKPKEK